MSDLEQFVLDYLQEADSIVEPPAYGVYEVLLPEAVAGRWQVPAYLQLAFAETAQEDVTQLGYNHPLVAQMVQEAHEQPASARLYVNNLRLDKSGVDELAIKSWAILNARSEGGKFTSVEDFAKRVNAAEVNRKVWESLTKAGAFDNLAGAVKLIPGNVGIKEAIFGTISVVYGIGINQGVHAAVLHRVVRTAVSLVVGSGFAYQLIRRGQVGDAAEQPQKITSRVVG